MALNIDLDAIYAGGTFAGVGLVPDAFLAGLTWGATAVGDPDPALAPGRLAAAPNPFRSNTTLSFVISRAGRVSLGVYDPGGRLVRILGDSRLDAGSHRVAWDGRDQAGRPVESGVYFFRAQSPRGDLTSKVVRIR